MIINLNSKSQSDYRLFLRAKSLPSYKVTGNTIYVPDEYADVLRDGQQQLAMVDDYRAPDFMYDYQAGITTLAIRKRKYSVFADCGLGKTLIFLEFGRYAATRLPKGKCFLIVSPLMVISQTLEECEKFYGSTLPIEQVHANNLQDWLNGKRKHRIGIVNWDALRDDLTAGDLGGLAGDETSMLKSHYGKWGTTFVRLGHGLEWKMACTGTPAPNDRIEYANHAVFMDAYPNVNAFLARFFVNRGQTDNRWELKPHALVPFYRALSHWSIFLSNPGTYGWKDHSEPLPPINVHIDRVPLTSEQQALAYSKTGSLLNDQIGGIKSRSVMSQIAKGNYRGESIPTNKTEFIQKMVHSWPDRSTLIWCIYNAEQDAMAKAFPNAANIDGDTPHEVRQRYIAEFKAGQRKQLISKAKILGFGLNLQRCTKMVFSGCQDSYEMYYQCIKRANRIGSTEVLDVYLPVTDIERPMIETVLAKANRVNQDTLEQERIFASASGEGITQ